MDGPFPRPLGVGEAADPEDDDVAYLPAHRRVARQPARSPLGSVRMTGGHFEAPWRSFE